MIGGPLQSAPQERAPRPCGEPDRQAEVFKIAAGRLHERAGRFQDVRTAPCLAERPHLLQRFARGDPQRQLDPSPRISLPSNAEEVGLCQQEASGDLRLALGERTFLVQPQRRRYTPSTGSGRTGVIRAAAREASGAFRLALGERTFLVQPQRRRDTPSTGSGRTGVIRAATRRHPGPFDWLWANGLFWFSPSGAGTRLRQAQGERE